MRYDSRHSARDGNPWWTVVIACLGMTMSFLTVTATLTALSAITSDLGLGPVELVWTSSAYSLALAAFVLSSGALGDLVGRRTVFLAGTAVLGAGAVLTASAGGPAVLIVGEVVMGAGAALVVPNSLAIVAGAFGDPRRRASAVGVWAACSGIGLAVGPIAAGSLLSAFSWHAVFLVDVVVAVVVLVSAPFVVRNTRVPGRGIDVPGTALATVAVAALVVGVVEGGRSGFGSAVPVLGFVLAVAAGAGFVVVEHRVARPVVDLRAFAAPRTVSALLVSAVALFTFTGLGLLTTLEMQRAQGFSALASGVRLLSLMVAYVVVSSLAAAAVRRSGIRLVLLVGLAATAAGTLVLHQTGLGSSYAPTAFGFVLVGAGLGLLIAPTTALVVGSVPPERSGMAGSTVTTVRQVGGALGGSVLGTVVTNRLTDHLADGDAAPVALIAAVHDGLLVATGVLLVALLTTAALLRSPRTSTAPLDAPEGVPA